MSMRLAGATMLPTVEESEQLFFFFFLLLRCTYAAASLGGGTVVIVMVGADACVGRREVVLFQEVGLGLERARDEN